MRIIHPLQQHVGAPAIPVVSCGDQVKRGQLLAEPNVLGANIHASLSGTVKTVSGESIVIEGDNNQDDTFMPFDEPADYIEAIREAGIVGAGGAGFPTAVKIKSLKNPKMVIANGTECEPMLQHNINFMQTHPEILIRGLKYLQEITGAPIALIVLKEKNKVVARDLLNFSSREKRIRIKLLPDRYPAGDERVIVRELVGLELKPGELPTENGLLIQNVETIKRIVEAIEFRKPFIDKDITVAGRVKDTPKGKPYMDVPLGTPIGHFIEASGGFEEPYGEIVIGGPFTGKTAAYSSPVTKTTGGIMVGMPFPAGRKKMGVLACECGAQEERLQAIAREMGAEEIIEVKCKRMEEVNGRFRCNKPGICPGQAETVMELKKKGVDALLTGSCDE